MPFFENVSHADDDEIRGGMHRCDVGDIDYSRAMEGHLACRVCKNTWSLGDYGWVSFRCRRCDQPRLRCRCSGGRHGRR